MVSIDNRGLAIWRIGTASLVLVDLALRARDLAAHYADAGVLPRALFSDAASPAFYRFPWSYVSPFLWHGGAAWTATLGALLALAAILLAVGWRPRLTGGACWFLLASLDARNAWLLDGGDAVLRLVLFWGWLCGRAGYRFQLAMIYFFAGYHKHGWDGDALRAVLSLEDFARPWTRGLLDHPGLLAIAAPAVRVAEMTLPLLFFVPYARARAAATALLMLFHLATACLLDLGIFPFVCLVALTGVVAAPPPRTWPGITIAALMALVLLANFDLAPARRLAGVLWLEQEWKLFDVVPRADVRFTLVADGKTITGGWERRNVRWRNYLLRLEEFGGSREHAALARWLCGETRSRASDTRLIANGRELWRGDCQSFAR